MEREDRKRRDDEAGVTGNCSQRRDVEKMEASAHSRRLRIVSMATGVQRDRALWSRTERNTATRPDTRHKMRLVSVLSTFENNTEQTDSWTYGQTDGHSYRDATALLKIAI